MSGVTLADRAIGFVYDFVTVGGNGEGWTWRHLEAVAAVATGNGTAEDRRIASQVIELDGDLS